MSTEVKHGHEPFEAVTHGEFSAWVVGHYTDTPDLAAAGVKTAVFQSERPEKRRAELLALRTAFLDWFMTTWTANGGTREDAIEEVEQITARWREGRR